MARILIADDRTEDRSLLRVVIESMGHEVVEASDGVEALQVAHSTAPDAILSDVLMPRMDGFSLCRALQREPGLRHLPFVFVTATFAEQQSREFADDLGAARILQKPFDAGRLREVLEEVLGGEAQAGATQRLNRLDDDAFHARHADVVARKLEQKVEELETANEALVRSDNRNRELLMALVETVSKMVEVRDPYTLGHQRRVGDLAAEIARETGLDETLIQGIRLGGYLHDVGKIAVPADLLSKPNQLRGAELTLIRIHAESGRDILSGVDFPWPLAEIAHQHHERMDGSGYPRGLKGEEILPEARIIAVADVVEAMTSHRPYRAGLGIEQALAEVERGRGTLYDAAATDACLALFREGRYQLS